MTPLAFNYLFIHQSSLFSEHSRAIMFIVILILLIHPALTYSNLVHLTDPSLAHNYSPNPNLLYLSFSNSFHLIPTPCIPYATPHLPCLTDRTYYNLFPFTLTYPNLVQLLPFHLNLPWPNHPHCLSHVWSSLVHQSHARGGHREDTLRCRGYALSLLVA